MEAGGGEKKTAAISILHLPWAFEVPLLLTDL